MTSFDRFLISLNIPIKSFIAESNEILQVIKFIFNQDFIAAIFPEPQIDKTRINFEYVTYTTHDIELINQLTKIFSGISIIQRNKLDLLLFQKFHSDISYINNFKGYSFIEKIQNCVLSLLLSCYLGERTIIHSQIEFMSQFPVIKLGIISDYHADVEFFQIIAAKYNKNGPGAVRALWKAAPKPAFCKILQLKQQRLEREITDKKNQFVSFYQNQDGSLKQMTIPVLRVFLETLLGEKLENIDKIFSGKTLFILRKITQNLDQNNTVQAIIQANKLIKLPKFQKLDQIQFSAEQILINFPGAEYSENQDQLLRNTLNVTMDEFKQFGYYTEISEFLAVQDVRQTLCIERIYFQDFVVSWSQVKALLKLCQKMNVFCLKMMKNEYFLQDDLGIDELLLRICFGGNAQEIRYFDLQLVNIDNDVIGQRKQHPLQVYTYCVRSLLKLALQTQKFKDLVQYGLVMQQLEPYTSEQTQILGQIFNLDPVELQKNTDQNVHLAYIFQTQQVDAVKCLKLINQFNLQPLKSNFFAIQTRQIQRVVTGQQLQQLVSLLSVQKIVQLAQIVKGELLIIPNNATVSVICQTIQSNLVFNIQNEFLSFNYRVVIGKELYDTEQVHNSYTQLFYFFISVLVKNFEELEQKVYDFGELLIKYQFAE